MKLNAVRACVLTQSPRTSALRSSEKRHEFFIDSVNFFSHQNVSSHVAEKLFFVFLLFSIYTEKFDKLDKLYLLMIHLALTKSSTFISFSTPLLSRHVEPCAVFRHRSMWRWKIKVADCKHCCEWREQFWDAMEFSLKSNILIAHP